MPTAQAASSSPLAPWRSPLARALHRNRALAHSRYLQLATVQPTGRPANRTLVFRGFWADTNQLKFVTDARSEKAAQIALNPWAEVCWYFAKTREQFRLSGTLTLVDRQAPGYLQTARAIAWHDLSDNARSQFMGAPPGQIKSAAPASSLNVSDPDMPSPHFCLLLLEPVQVDHLELRGAPQQRWRYQLEHNNWQCIAINP